MKKKIKHIPVLKKKVIQGLNIKKNGIYIDATFGCGGHSNQILKTLGPFGKLYAFDRDPESIKIAKKIKDKRFKIIFTNFSKIYKYVKKNKLKNKIDGILIDLGTSALQIDNSKRGFSYIKNGPLDMRMNQNKGISALEWIKKCKFKNLKKTLKKYGEEKFSHIISKNICIYKKKKSILNTKTLVSIIKKSTPYRKGNPAKKTFQAIRIKINNEIKELKKILKKSKKILSYNGRLVTISFHSLEDRIIKKFIFNNSKKKIKIPHKLPLTNIQIKKKICSNTFKLLKKEFPSKKEIRKNKRSKSAILRISKFKLLK